MGLWCASSYFKLRYNLSTKTLSNQRPQPSRLIKHPDGLQPVSEESAGECAR